MSEGGKDGYFVCFSALVMSSMLCLLLGARARGAEAGGAEAAGAEAGGAEAAGAGGWSCGSGGAEPTSGTPGITDMPGTAAPPPGGGWSGGGIGNSSISCGGTGVLPSFKHLKISIALTLAYVYFSERSNGSSPSAQNCVTTSKIVAAARSVLTVFMSALPARYWLSPLLNNLSAMSSTYTAIPRKVRPGARIFAGTSASPASAGYLRTISRRGALRRDRSLRGTGTACHLRLRILNRAQLLFFRFHLVHQLHDEGHHGFVGIVALLEPPLQRIHLAVH